MARRSHDQGAVPFGPPILGPTGHGRRQLGERIEIAEGLTPSVWEHAGLAATAADVGDRLDDAGLVVHPHHRQDGRPAPQRVIHGREVHNTARAHREHLLGSAEMAHHVRGSEHRLVLDGGDGDPQSRPAGAGRERRAHHRQVVCLGSARGEADLRGLGVHRPRHLAACLLQPGARGASEAVGARRVAERAPEKGQHSLPDLGADRGRGGVVEVYGLHGRER